MKRLKLLDLLARSSVLMAARLVGAGVSFVGSILVARYFGADALGIVALCSAFMSLLALAAGAGRPAVGVMFVSEYLVQDRPDLIKGFIRSGWRVIARVSLLAIAVLLAAYTISGDAIRPEWLTACIFACITAPAVALINFNGSIMSGFRRQLVALIPDLLVKPILTFIAMVIAALLAPPEASLALLAGIFVALWLTAFCQWWLISKRDVIPLQPENLKDLPRWQRVAMPWIAIVLLSDYLVELHLLLSGLLFLPAQVAILHICFRIRMLASFGMRALNAMIMPDIYAAHARSDGLSLARDITRANALSLVYAIAACLGITLFGELFLGLFGVRFVTGFSSLLICCLTMIPRAVFGPATAIMAVAGRQRSMIVILIVAIAISALTIALTLGTLGLESIAVGYTIAISFASVAQWFWTFRTTGIDCSIFAALTVRIEAEVKRAKTSGNGTVYEMKTQTE